MTVKFLWNGIKVDGELYRCSYGDGKLIGYPNGTITIYGKDYRSFPRIEGLTITNESDIMTDYFENDCTLVTPDNVWYAQAKSACDKAKEHFDRRLAKRYGR